MVSKLSKISSGFFIPDPDPPIPDPGVKKALDPGSGTLKTMRAHLQNEQLLEY
jgi:hypothetical protein